MNIAPTIGHGINKVRPCLVISPDEMNSVVSTVIVAPLITKACPYPTRVPVRFDGKDGWVGSRPNLHS